jgi:sarcosine oxidase/L-pipecolate oxidase
MASPNDSKYSHLIIGSGVFGASTAYHLSKTHPTSKIALLDRSPSYPCPLAASHDYNKIIRADYGNPFYCSLALEAREAWEKEPLYKDLFNETGMVVLDDTGLGRKIIKNYDDLNTYSEAVIISPKDLKSKYEGLFEDADLTGIDEVFVNPVSGCAEATKAVKAVIEATVSNGVEYIEGDVARLIFDTNGDCTGVETKDGKSIVADKVILSTGAGTQKLLADSAPHRPDIQSEDRITAAAVVTGVVMLTSEQMKRFEKAPIFIHSGDIMGMCSSSQLLFSTEHFNRRSPSTNTRRAPKVLRRCQFQEHITASRVRQDDLSTPRPARPSSTPNSRKSEGRMRSCSKGYLWKRPFRI